MTDQIATINQATIHLDKLKEAIHDEHWGDARAALERLDDKLVELDDAA